MSIIAEVGASTWRTRAKIRNARSDNRAMNHHGKQ
jgi:hypothetical protein